MRGILALSLSLLIFLVTINPAYAVFVSAGSFSAGASDYVDEGPATTLYSYTASSGQSIIRIQGHFDTYNMGNDHYIAYIYIYDDSGNVIDSASGNTSDPEFTLNTSCNASSMIVKASASRDSYILNWSLTVEVGADVADNASVIQARDAANAAKTSAESAATNSANALNGVSNSNGNTVTAVRDASGTVLSEARQAKTNAQNAYNSAQTANTNALNAYSTAQTVNTKVDALTNAVNDINTSIVGVSDDNSLIVSAVRDPDDTVLSVSKVTQGAVEDATGNTVSAVRDSTGTVLDASRSANGKIDTLQTTVTNIQNTLGSDTAPPVVKIRTVSGAAATTGNSIRTVVSASDNISAVFKYSLDEIDYQPLPSDGVTVLPLSAPGPNLITVWVKDEAGNVGRDSITIRKI